MTLYRIVLEGRGHRAVPLDYMQDRDDARTWAAFMTGGYVMGGLPNGDLVVGADLQKNGDWCLKIDGGPPVWVRIQERDDDDV